MSRKLIPIPKDAPPITATTLRDMADRIYALEGSRETDASTAKATDKGLGATVQNLSGTVADLESRYAVVGNGEFNTSTGSIPADSTFRNYGPEMSVTVESPGPHKQLVIHVGAAGVTIDSKSASSSVTAEVTFKFAGGSVGYGTYVGRMFLSRVNYMGMSIYSQREFRLAKGVYTITAVTRGWNGIGGDATNSIIFRQPFLRAEIVGDSGQGDQAV
jgi:hypothetical protein